ncbi:conserved hypothetical protein [Xylanimonas cellulosilytica DSM 15894]|uniref:Uncharacterized protein n=1 Tax=Xylanimonas cellulosilytica (strain DSM 15894 / JCM 12276 / CECT 5975 / KCTC 9989 / LMG 20990 / NBRC 107835 / XIL07) TaxID=446471 RepID=D1BW72_XYLCX|nr:DUF2190 family protein [Xylanimonas cellulosilytica]ACZ29575.1 conserved hypothetical protein [Xylanimonas cellulosilytica DSM 15894]
MATNEVFRDADHLTLPVAEGVKSGAPVTVGSLVGVAITDRADDGTATVRLKGASLLPVTGGGITQVGTPVYITSAGALNITATDNTLFGYALATKSSGSAEIPVRIAQV